MTVGWCLVLLGGLAVAWLSAMAFVEAAEQARNGVEGFALGLMAVGGGIVACAAMTFALHGLGLH